MTDQKTTKDQETQTTEQRILDNPWYTAAKKKVFDDWWEEASKDPNRKHYRVVKGDPFDPHDNDIEYEEIPFDELTKEEQPKPSVMQPLATGDDAPRALLQSPPPTEMQQFAQKCLFWELDNE